MEDTGIETGCSMLRQEVPRFLTGRLFAGHPTMHHGEHMLSLTMLCLTRCISVTDTGLCYFMHCLCASSKAC